MRLHSIVLCLWIPLSGLSAAVGAQEFPSRPIVFVVPTGPGGGTDILGRHVAQRLSELWNTPVVVENRGGAGSVVGTAHVAKARPDGHTMLVGGLSNMVMNKALIKDLPYDPLRDFVPIGYTSAYPFLLMVRIDLPVSDLRGFVEYAKSRPGKLTFGSAGIGGLQHVWGTVLVKSLGLELVHVPFKSGPLAVQDVLAGRIDMIFDNLSATKQYVHGARLKGLGVSSIDRSPHLPNVPTINETRTVQFSGESWFGLFAPAATPPATVVKLRNAIASIIRERDFVARIEQDGGRVLDVSTEDQVQFLRDEGERWIRLVQRYEVNAE